MCRFCFSQKGLANKTGHGGAKKEILRLLCDENELIAVTGLFPIFAWPCPALFAIESCSHVDAYLSDEAEEAVIAGVQQRLLQALTPDIACSPGCMQLGACLLRRQLHGTDVQRLLTIFAIDLITIKAAEPLGNVASGQSATFLVCQVQLKTVEESIQQDALPSCATVAEHVWLLAPFLLHPLAIFKGHPMT